MNRTSELAWLDDGSKLIAAATHIRSRAYVPYSKFKVGAALQAHDGRSFVGINMENVSYGLTICAERQAIGQGIAAGVEPYGFVGLAVVAGGTGYLSPCGACRQVLSEFVAIHMPIWLYNLDLGTCIQTNLAQLLPQPFTMDP